MIARKGGVLVTANELVLQWSAIYQPAWDAQPEQYVENGLVGWGRSRRLARGSDAAHAFQAYLGVHHTDPRRWGELDNPHTRFFLSLFLAGRTVSMRTYATLPEALEALRTFHTQLVAGWPAAE